MADQIISSDLVVRPSYDIQLQDFEVAILSTLGQHGLPTEGIFVPVNERLAVSRNIQSVLMRLSDDKKSRSVYISKFVAAVAAGLFDAALNYLWDETISELRQRVAQYDLSYFYANAVSQEKSKKLSTAEDLNKIEDSELIHGAKEIELISELGFRHLEYIRGMRNWASAAHPNQNEITGLQIIGWLETCIREIISLPLSPIAVQVKRLLANIKSNSISDAEAEQIAVSFDQLTQDQVKTLASGFFGIYIRPETTPQTRQNINRLLPRLWPKVDESTRQQFGVKYSGFVIHADKEEEKKFARQFLEIVSATSYIPSNLRAVEIKTAVENLLAVHRQLNNFHNEPAFARELQRLVGELGKIPPQVIKLYVLGLVEVFLTNGYGISWDAEPVYRSLLGLFDATQAAMVVLSFDDINIASKLQFALCRKKYYELLEMMKIKVSSVPVKELISDIEAFTGSLGIMRETYQFKQKVANLQKIIG